METTQNYAFVVTRGCGMKMMGHASMPATSTVVTVLATLVHEMTNDRWAPNQATAPL